MGLVWSVSRRMSMGSDGVQTFRKSYDRAVHDEVNDIVLDLETANGGLLHFIDYYTHAREAIRILAEEDAPVSPYDASRLEAVMIRLETTLQGFLDATKDE